ncbi:hypothetical protein HU200_025768 [Digitaria exilis]|uniref:Fatty acyl-CoA reductase n=1 Tax=Digitaria exilis TaxID=1010633 RepID=A0A835C8D1_9POAL|nr:hypothetical protein HU200_025768 [Digitaria exilis]
MGSSCVNLSRAVVLPAGGAARRVSSSVRQRRRAAAPVVVAVRYCRGGTVLVAPWRGARPELARGRRRRSLQAHGIGGDAGPMSPPESRRRIGSRSSSAPRTSSSPAAPGFLAKVLIEKILRTNPDVGKIYVLIKARTADAALRRLHNEVVDTELFRCLQEIHGKDYSSFIATKLVPVVGDVREANIGIAPELADEIGRTESKHEVLFCLNCVLFVFGRAKLHGWQDTYVFTKAMGEDGHQTACEGRYPWSTSGPASLRALGETPSGLDGREQSAATWWVNATLASMAYHGGGGVIAGPGMHVYHVSSSSDGEPLVFGDLSRFLFQHFTKLAPTATARGSPSLCHRCVSSTAWISFASYVRDGRAASGRAPGHPLLRLRPRATSPEQRLISRQRRSTSAPSPWSRRSTWAASTSPHLLRGRFDNGNTEALFAAMSPAERRAFHFDVRSVDWTDYITNVHIPGLRKHVRKAGRRRQPAARQHLRVTSPAGEGMRDGRVQCLAGPRLFFCAPRAMMTHDHSDPDRFM